MELVVTKSIGAANDKLKRHKSIMKNNECTKGHLNLYHEEMKN